MVSIWVAVAVFIVGLILGEVFKPFSKLSGLSGKN